MRKNQSSLSAAGIAIARAVESEKSAEKRICYDPFARQFAPKWMYHFVAFFIKSGYAERRGPGVNGFLLARERYIDDVLQDYINKGLQQLIILGAGYDSRAYPFRFSEDIKIFEIDHPATQAEKLEKLKRIFHKTPEFVRYIPIDFDTQALPEGLLSSGYDPDRISLFIWQGVSMYLTPLAVDATLNFIIKNSAPGSAVVFDYVYQTVLEGIQKQNEISNMRRYRFMTGEKLTFGIPEGTVNDFLMIRGFRHVKDINTDELKAITFSGENAKRKISGGYGIVIGKV